MKQDNTNSTPLWRELRDKITSGEAGANTHSQYTALAVNNLHKLAEALDTVMARLATFTESSAWEPEDEDAYDIGAEALAAIS